jgi:UDP-N-acetylglucosamine diphosphorylase/glucosamine-1-phosphate N-acetyltransferase
MGFKVAQSAFTRNAWLAFLAASGYLHIIMATTLCIFEDAEYAQLLPLAYLRPTWDLRCGILTLGEKIERAFPEMKIRFFCRGFLEEVVWERQPSREVNTPLTGESLFVNGRVLADSAFAQCVRDMDRNTLCVHGSTIVAALVDEQTARHLQFDSSSLPDFSALAHLPRRETAQPLISFPWDLVNNNGSQIVADFGILTSHDSVARHGTLYPGAHLLNPGAIAIGAQSSVKPGVVLDAENGPIFIGTGVRILPNAVIEGPAFIGDGSLIKVGAKIYEHTSIGPVCKVGGEVEASIIHGYANKQHDGFLGHAYLSPWVNLGADTNNSDLKNNYGTVRVTINGREVDSGSLFAGLIMGDHAKSAINTMFNTGTVVGVGSNVFGGGFPPKYIPSFSWGGADGMTTYAIDKCIAVARKVMERRKKSLSPAEEAMLRNVFALTEAERK